MIATASPTRTRSSLRSMVRGGLIPTLPLVAVAPLVAWAFAGEWAGVSALLGAVLSIAIFLLGVGGIRGVLAGPKGTTMLGAFGVFILQMVLLAVLFTALRQVSWTELMPLVLAFVVVGLVFQAGLVMGYLRSRSPLNVKLPHELAADREGER